MNSVVMFLAGYALGAKAGTKGYDELVRAALAIKESEEVKAMGRALRSHVGYTLREVADMLARPEPLAVGDVLERARWLAGNFDPRTKAT